MPAVSLTDGLKHKLLVPSPRRRTAPGHYPATNTFFVVADTAGDLYVDLSGVLKPGVHNMGLQLQPHGCDVTPAGTLCDPTEVAADANNAPWFAWDKISDENILSLMPVTPLVLKLTFSGAGRCYISCF